MYQPNDIVVHENSKYTVKGVQNRGAYIKICNASETKVVSIRKVNPFRYKRGIYATSF